MKAVVIWFSFFCHDSNSFGSWYNYNIIDVTERSAECLVFVCFFCCSIKKFQLYTRPPVSVPNHVAMETIYWLSALLHSSLCGSSSGALLRSSRSTVCLDLCLILITGLPSTRGQLKQRDFFVVMIQGANRLQICCKCTPVQFGRLFGDVEKIKRFRQKKKKRTEKVWVCTSCLNKTPVKFCH